MNVSQYRISTERYARCIEISRRVRWDIDRDVIRGREFDFSRKFLPDGISRMGALDFLNADDKRLISQVQGRTYANMFGLVERFINAKVLEVCRDHCLGDQTALQALVRFSDEELKHQELFRRIEKMIGDHMPAGYTFLPRPDAVAAAVLGKSTWAVLGLTLNIELFTQSHYKESIEPDENLSALFKDVFLYHWKEESQHAIMDEMEWLRENRKLDAQARDLAVDELIELVGAVDGLLQQQAGADVNYFLSITSGRFNERQVGCLRTGVLGAYRWQYIVSGVQLPRFQNILGSMITPAQASRIETALAPILN